MIQERLEGSLCPYSRKKCKFSHFFKREIARSFREKIETLMIAPCVEILKQWCEASFPFLQGAFFKCVCPEISRTLTFGVIFALMFSDDRGSHMFGFLRWR